MSFSDILKPTALSFFLLALLCGVQFVFLSNTSVTFSLDKATPPAYCYSYGLGSPITVTGTETAKTTEIRWGILILNVATFFILAGFLAACIRWITGFRKPACVYLAASLVACLVAFPASISLSRVVWGYYFSRPPILSEASRIVKVDAVFPVKTERAAAERGRFVVQDDFSLAERIARAENDPYYCLDARILLHLKQAGLLPSGHSLDLRDIAPLYTLISGSGVLAAPDEGYTDSDLLWGVVVDARNASDERLVFAGLCGGQLSNDHYPYYEMVFKESPSDHSLSLVRHQRFFYDNAGMEGLEWYVIWPPLTLAGLLVGLPVFTIGIGLQRAIRYVRARRASLWPVS